MRVTLTRRLGQNETGSVITVTDTQGQWLYERGHAIPHAEPLGEHDAPPEPPDAPADATSTDAGTLAELRARAESLGLPTYGSKATLAARIAEHGDRDER